MKKSITPKSPQRGPLSGARLLALAAVLAVPAATFGQTFWTNSTGDFNVASSWNPNGVPGGVVNVTDDNGSNNVILIQPGDPVFGHGDTLAGQTGGSSGAYLQTGSTNNTGYPTAGNWLRLGIGTGGTAGYYTLSNGVVNVAGQTHLGEHGFGQLTVAGGTYNTGFNGNPGICAGDGDFGVSSGVLNLYGGTISNLNNETWFGEGSGCTGYLNMSGGTFYARNWFVFGRNGGAGYGVMTGGTLNFTGGGQFLIGGGGVGSLAQSGGTINAYNQYLVPQSNGGGGVGTNIVSGTAVLNVHDWLAVGRNGGYGELDVSGGAAITRDNINANNPGDSNSHFDVGAGGKGVVNQTGGIITESTSDLWIGETANGTWNLNGGTDLLQNVVMCLGSGANGNLNLNAGLFQANEIYSTNGTVYVSLLNLNGATLRANTNSSTFISGLSIAQIGGGGATIDSQGYKITIPEPLQDNNGGAATLTKLGSGTLILSGANTYGGLTTVSAGTVIVGTSSTGGGSYTVANNSGLGVLVQGYNGAQLYAPSVTLGSSDTLNFDLGGYGNASAAPLSVSGTLTGSGTITVNVSDFAATVGQFPLIQFGALAGTANFVLGSLPTSVVGNLVTNGSTIALNITSVNLPYWDGLAGGNWDIGVTTNWFNYGTSLPTYYSDGSPVVFDDSASGSTTVNVVTTVSPVSVNFNNNSLSYTLVGSGKIAGATGVNVNGAGSVSIQTVNSYTGPTTISGGGVLSVTNLANGGSSSSIGASSANPTNLVISAATLSYSGPAVSVNRGYSIQNTNSAIDAENNLTLSGTTVAASDADFVKAGPAQLTYATVGTNALSGSASAGYRTIAGTTQFGGSSTGQVDNVLGHFGVGGLGATNAAVILTNATLNVSSGLDLGRSGGATGTLFINSNGTLNVTGGSDVALGDGGGTVSTGVVNQVAGVFNINGPQTFIGQGVAGVGTYNLSGGTLYVNNWLAIGRANGTGTLNISGTGVLDVTGGGGNLDIGTSAGIGGDSGNGTLNQTGGAITNTATQTWLGEGVSGQSANGTWNMTAGIAQLGELHVALGGTGTSTVNVSGTASITSGFLGLSLNDTNSTGNLNIGSASLPGGTVTVQSDMTVGDQGNATLNFPTNGGGKLTVTGTMYLSRSGPTANGIVNLNTSNTLVLAYLNNGWGFHNNYSSATDNPNAFNFNGGTLKAYVGSAYFIQPYVNTVVQGGGAIIDDSGFFVEDLGSLVSGGGNGGLTKIGIGTLRLDGTNTYTGTTLVSTGTLQVGPAGAITGPVAVASGATLTGTGVPYSIYNTLTLSNGSTAAFSITATTNDEVTGLSSVSYAGALVVTANGTTLTQGSTYKLFSAASAGSGNFSSVTILPNGTGSFNPATGVLTITSVGSFSFNPVKVVNGSLILTGSGGLPNSPYNLLSTTNLLPPVAWITNSTGTLDGSGDFSNAIPISTTGTPKFFKAQYP